MVRTQIQLTEEQAAILREMADQQKTSVAALIRRAIDVSLRSREYATREQRRGRAIATSAILAVLAGAT